jgi:hypothetical protein
MQRCQGPIGEIVNQRRVDYVDVKVKNVELVDPAAHLVQHDYVVRQGIAHDRIEAQCHVTAAHEPRGRLGIAAGKQRDLMSLAHELFSQEGNDPFRTAIEPRWYAFMQRSYLSNTHRLPGQVGKAYCCRINRL